MTFGKKLVSQSLTSGDLNALFASFFDQLVTLFIIAGLLIGIGFPSDFVNQRVLPGLVIGILFANIVLAWMAHRLEVVQSRKITALPFGIDLPSAIAIIVLVVGPTYRATYAETLDTNQALMASWGVGAAITVWAGIIKLTLSYSIVLIRRIFPEPIMLASIAGIGLVWLGANALAELYKLPTVGILALTIIITSLLAMQRMPYRMPGVIAAIVVGLPLYFLIGIYELPPGNVALPGLKTDFSLAVPAFHTQSVTELFGSALPFVPVVLPFALAEMVGVGNLVAAARQSGDNYRARPVIWVDGFSTMVAGLLGGIGQSTVYLGHQTYKKLGAGISYAMFASVIVAIVSLVGVLGLVSGLLPQVVILPLLIVISIDLCLLAYRSASKNQKAAVLFTFVPAIVSFSAVKVKDLLAHVQSYSESMNSADVSQVVPDTWLENFATLHTLSSGYILTSMVLGATLYYIVERKGLYAASLLVAAAAMSLVGLIHSVHMAGIMYLPWNLTPDLVYSERSLSMPYELACGYLLGATFLVANHFIRRRRERQQSLADVR